MKKLASVQRYDGKGRDWAAQDARGAAKGSLTLIYSSEVLRPAKKAPAVGRGRPRLYDEEQVKAAVFVKLLTRFSYRATESFLKTLSAMLGVDCPVADYSTLSRRFSKLSLDLSAPPVIQDKVLLVDSTGFKLCGEGEWKVRQHGQSKRRSWKKVHVLVDYETGSILSMEITAHTVHDGPVLSKLLPQESPGCVVHGDGAYASRKLHEEVATKGAELVSRPAYNTKLWPTDPTNPAIHKRNQHVREIRAHGLTGWAKLSGYGRRSLVEVTMHQLKSYFSQKVSSKSPNSVQNELKAYGLLLNDLLNTA